MQRRGKLHPCHSVSWSWISDRMTLALALDRSRCRTLRMWWTFSPQSSSFWPFRPLRQQFLGQGRELANRKGFPTSAPTCCLSFQKLPTNDACGRDCANLPSTDCGIGLSFGILSSPYFCRSFNRVKAWSFSYNGRVWFRIFSSSAAKSSIS